MQQPLTIGKLNFETHLIQGPLAGFTCAPMRVQTWKYGAPAYCSTEMVSATHLVHAKDPPARYLYRDPDEGPLCFQLSGSDPQDLAKATQIVNQTGAEIIELNCGCPVQKIRRKGAGSKLLTEMDRLQRLIAAIRDNTDAAVSIKIRVADHTEDQDDLLIAQIAEQAGADCLVVHGRHWTERYDVPPRYQQIKQIVDHVSIPVIGNGDVCDKASLQTMQRQTGCAGVMIARASMGQPWLFQQLSQADFTLPTIEEIGATFIDHINQLAKLDAPYRAVLQARKMGKYYARQHLTNSKPFLEQLMQCTCIDAFKALVTQFFISTTVVPLSGLEHFLRLQPFVVI